MRERFGITFFPFPHQFLTHMEVEDMALKQEMTKNETRILILLSQIRNENRYGWAISNKLGIGYGYCLQILGKMLQKGWIRVEEYGTKRYFFIKDSSKVELAKSVKLNGK